MHRPIDRATTLKARAARANKMLSLFQTESPRGKALILDSYIDELLNEIFRARFVPSKRVDDILGDSGFLSSTANRLSMAFALGWVGATTYADARTVRKIRNAFAHDADVIDFDHSPVKELCENLEFPKDKAFPRLAYRRDKFLLSAQCVAMQLWEVLDRSSHPTVGVDEPIYQLDPSLFKR